MFSKLVSLALLTALAGRALAFNVSVGTTIFQANEVLDFTLTPVIASCDAGCGSVKTAIDACNADPACLCNAAVATPLQACEQCMFTALIDANKPAPDPRAGSNVVLGGWTAKCAAANLTLPTALGLTLPPTWDGPFVAVFPTAVGWVIAVTGGVLGSSLIYMLCNM
ncbi:hypothetical protein B0H10DRAFT_2430701 [Mycena sp. CBHHK59/15]|nr:hypothetical protein B0H10DRAFT_2430701 [Mycena sp. CBHHK59/15]